MEDKTSYKATAAALLLYAIISIAAFTLLGIFFDFPDILRKPMEERFALFQQQEGIIVPTYYFFAFTGILQIIFSVQRYKIHNSARTDSLLGLVFGILAGFTQTLGFIRWVVVIPYLSKRSAQTDVHVFETVLNAYLGMSVGEHLGTLFAAFWLICTGMTMRETKFFDKRLDLIALVSGILMIPVAFEPIIPSLPFLGLFTIPVWGLVITWMLLLAYSLFKRKEEIVSISGLVWLIAGIFWLVNVIPAFLP